MLDASDFRFAPHVGRQCKMLAASGIEHRYLNSAVYQLLRRKMLGTYSLRSYSPTLSLSRLAQYQHYWPFV